MIQKTTASLALLLVLASCDRKQNLPPRRPGDISEIATKNIRADQTSNFSGARDKLRSALEIAKAKEPGEERNKVIAEIAWKALEFAPDIAAQAIHELPAGIEEKESLIEAYARKLISEKNTDEILTWTDSLGDEQVIASARGKIVIMLDKTHPEQIIKLLPAFSFTATGVDPKAELVLQNWVSQEPAGAATWATSLPVGEARAVGFKIIFSQWITDDARNALSWVASQNNAQVRKEAKNAMVESLSELPGPIRSSLLESADSKIRVEIEQGIAEIFRQSQTAEPESEPAPEPESGTAAPPEMESSEEEEPQD